jgi:3-oxoacyl-[acyl-carrier-protein] synthase III
MPRLHSKERVLISSHMSKALIDGIRIAGISSCTPACSVDNMAAGAIHGAEEVRKVVEMAGVKNRRVVDPGICSSDLCFQAAKTLMEQLGWEPESITGLIMVTQSPDYFLPSTSCLLHKWLGLSPDCATFDVGLGCSGYPYGLYITATLLKAGGHGRILVLHGETPSLFPAPEDRATSLLFGDAGSATALTLDPSARTSAFTLCTDGNGYDGLIIRGGGFRDRFPADLRDLNVSMDGAAIFNFTIQRVPPLIQDTLELASLGVDDIDCFAFHQSNQYIMKYLASKCGVPLEKLPIVLGDFGNTGGASVPLTITSALAPVEGRGLSRVMMVGYGVGLSWGAAIMDLSADTVLLNSTFDRQTNDSKLC